MGISRPKLLARNNNVDTAMVVGRAMKNLNIPNGIIHQLNDKDVLKYFGAGDNKSPCTGC